MENMSCSSDSSISNLVFSALPSFNAKVKFFVLHFNPRRYCTGSAGSVFFREITNPRKSAIARNIPSISADLLRAMEIDLPPIDIMKSSSHAKIFLSVCEGEKNVLKWCLRPATTAFMAVW